MNHQPPKWANKFLEWFCKPELLEALQGDLYESLRDDIQPIIHFHRVPTSGAHRYITVRTNGQRFNETLAFY